MLGYNYSGEFAIYNFKTYSAWECYVRSLYQDEPLSELNEFIKYLNYRKRIDSTAGVLTYNLLIPLMIALLSTWIMSALNDISPNDIKIMHSFFVFLLQIDFVMGAIVFFEIILSKLVFSDKQVEVFYEDYMKIIDGIITDRKNCNVNENE